MTAEVIRPKEPLNDVEIMVLGLMAHNNTMKEIRQKLIWHEQYLTTKKWQISRKMGESETEEGICRAIVWAVSTDRITLSSRRGFSASMRLEDGDLLFLAMMGRGMTKYEMASQLNIDPEDVAKKREQLSRRLNFKTIYATVAMAAYSMRQAEVRV